MVPSADGGGYFMVSSDAVFSPSAMRTSQGRVRVSVDAKDQRWL